MIKKIKLGLMIVVLSFVVGVNSVFADALTYDDDTTVTVGAYDYTILDGSTATSVAVGAADLTVVMPSGSTFTLTSSDRKLLGTDQASGYSSTCGVSLSTTVLHQTTGSPVTFVIAPTGDCTPVTGGGGGGGGSSTSPSVVPPVIPAVPATPGEIPGCGNRTTGFSTATGVSCVGNTSTTSATPASPSAKTWYDFGNKTLKNGSVGEAVKELQRFLNYKLNLGLVVDGKLGPKTIKVIKQWQKDNGLVADGLVGPKTKAMMNASVQ